MTHWLVVGGGTAGCVLAARLSDDPRNHVTVIEAGPAEIGATGLSYLDDLALGAVWPELTVTDGGDSRRPYPQGRVLGGSSAINGTVLSGAELPQYDEWGWTGMLAARARSQLPCELVPMDSLGPVDRALLRSDQDVRRATLSRHKGQRVSTADAYVRPARTRRNVEIVTDTLVDRVVLVGRRADGVLTARGDRLRADRVVCSAGAIHTPALLLRSGVDAPGVGVGLADHPSRMIEIALRPDASADPASVVTGAVLRRGAVEVVALNHLGPERPGAAALLVGLLSTTRQGSIRLDPARGDDPAASPVVDFGALSAHDGHFLDRGVAHAQQLLEGRSFGAIIVGFEVGRRFGGYAHASSSCRMGVVVDDGGAVVGYDGLFVCDASVFPEVPAAGTYLPTVLLAERLAALWLASG